MKKILLATTAVVAFSGASQAQVVFEGGVVDLGIQFVQGESFSLINAGTSAAFSVGNFGFQIDGAMHMYDAFDDGPTFSSYGLHFYKPTANGAKFVSSSAIYYTEVGAEVMFDLGPATIEASVGFLGYGPADNIVATGINASFDVTERLSFGAGYNVWFNDSDSFGFYNINAAYDINDTGLSVNASYSGYDDSSIGLIGVGVSWGFGPNSGNGLFNNRSMNFLFGA